jgi:hypothetical protein
MSFSPVNYSQQDPAWKNVKIGSSSETIGHVGCALTCVAMLVSGHGYPETPKALNAKLKARGGFVDASIVWGAITGIYPQIVYRGLVLCRDTNAPLAQIDASVAAGQPVLVEVDNSPKAGLQTHWVVLYKKQGEDYLMLDPWPYPSENGQEVFLMPRYSHGKALQKSITAAIFYECMQTGPGDSSGTAATKPAAPSEPGTYVKVPVTVEAGLRLRSAPSTASGTITVEPPGTTLRVIEALDVALPKIGAFDQWIKVRDRQGREGFVAAWYVESGPTVQGTETGSSEPEAKAEPIQAPVPIPESKPESTTTTVYVSGDATAGLRLRSAPSTNSSTLKILPPNTALTVLQGTAEMVGAQNTWLKVREPKGTEGFVAAWYVRK